MQTYSELTMEDVAYLLAAAGLEGSSDVYIEGGVLHSVEPATAVLLAKLSEPGWRTEGVAVFEGEEDEGDLPDRVYDLEGGLAALSAVVDGIQSQDPVSHITDIFPWEDGDHSAEVGRVVQLKRVDGVMSAVRSSKKQYSAGVVTEVDGGSVTVCFIGLALVKKGEQVWSDWRYISSENSTLRWYLVR